MAAIPQGVWSLKDAIARRELEEQIGRPKRKKKVVSVDSDEDEEVGAVAKKKNRKPPTKPPAKSTKAAKPSKPKQPAPRKLTSKEPELIDVGEEESNKTRKAPARGGRRRRTSSTEDEEILGRGTLRRPLPGSRKSPRIRDRAIVLDSDSEPELIPVRKPLRITNNTLPEAEQPAKPPTEPSKPPKQVSQPSTKPSEPSNQPTESTKQPSQQPRNKPATKKPVRPNKTGNKALNVSFGDEKPASKPVNRAVAALQNGSTLKLPEKRARRAPPAQAEVIKIPDSRAGAKRKLAITSNVVKIKKPAAPRKKKDAGPAKAGAVAPLPLSITISNPTQKTEYTLDKQLGVGGFGYIYIVTDDKTKKKAVMKVEPHDNGPLFSEMHFYQRAGKEAQLEEWRKKHKFKYLGIPHMMGFGMHEEGQTKFRYLVMPLFEGDLCALHKKHDNKFSVQTTILLCIRMLEALEYIHEQGYVHADVKSANILLRNSNKEAYLADFGLARKYTMSDEHKQYVEEPAKAHNGTKEFTSIDAHKGVQPSRRGDLQILGYCCIDWLGGKLPWFSWDNCNNIRAEKIKHANSSSDLLEGSIGLANLISKPWLAIKHFLAYSFALEYEAKPDYAMLYGKLRAGLGKSDTGYMIWN